MANKKEVTRENYQVSIGPIMKEVLDKQKLNIKEVTMEICEPSNWEAMEILGRKLLENNLV